MIEDIKANFLLKETNILDFVKVKLFKVLIIFS